jgi:hypothetical protein
VTTSPGTALVGLNELMVTVGGWTDANAEDDAAATLSDETTKSMVATMLRYRRDVFMTFPSLHPNANSNH